jgi:hypothetical protein
MPDIGTKKIKLAYNEFAYKKTKDVYKLKRPFFNRTKAKSQIKRLHIKRSACTVKLEHNNHPLNPKNYYSCIANV